MIMTRLKFGTWFSSWPISNQVMLLNRWSWPISNFLEKCTHTHTHTHPPKWVMLLSISWPHVKPVGWWWVYPGPIPMSIDNPFRVSEWPFVQWYQAQGVLCVPRENWWLDCWFKLKWKYLWFYIWNLNGTPKTMILSNEVVNWDGTLKSSNRPKGDHVTHF
jgi:hypothetical protein